jgi:SAM-dependent methyltransferase
MQTDALLEHLNLEPDSIVAELGAGHGECTLPIARRLDQLEGGGLVFALERSKPRMRQLESRAVEEDLDHRVRPLLISRYPRDRVPFHRPGIDRFVVINVAPEEERRRRVYEEVAGALRPGGIALFAWDTGMEEEGADLTLATPVADLREAGFDAPAFVKTDGKRAWIRVTLEARAS